MRKTLIALMLVLPMVFMLVVFSSVNLVSLGVNISVSGITIRAEGETDGTLFVNMADKITHVVTAEVSPASATEKGYTLSSSDPSVADVDKSGALIPKKEGTAEIVATSNDKSFTDTMSVVVVSSKPYDVRFSLASGEQEIPLAETENGYEGVLPSGEYSYQVSVSPTGFNEYTLEKGGSSSAEQYASIEKGAKTLSLPFTGTANFTLTVPDGIDGPIQKTVSLTVQKPSKTEGGKTAEAAALVNGHGAYPQEGSTLASLEEGESSLSLAYGTTSAQVAVECSGGEPTFLAQEHGEMLLGQTVTPLGEGRFILDFTFDAEEIEGNEIKTISGSLLAGGRNIPFSFSFTEFDFYIASDLTVKELASGGLGATLLTGSPAPFYAVTSGGAKDVTFEWTFKGPAEYLKAEGASATVTAKQSGEFVLSVAAAYNGKTAERKEITLRVIDKIGAVQIANDVNADLAANYTVAGMVYADDMKTVENSFPLRVFSGSDKGIAIAGDEVQYSVSDESVAEVRTGNGTPVLIPKGTGKVTVTAAWVGNDDFDPDVLARLTVNVVKDAVEVKNAPELIAAMNAKLPAVLTENISLGTDAEGKDLSIAQRTEYLKTHRMKSTYNIEWYKFASGAKESDAYISYVLEFTADVYGNGKSIDADNFTHALDAGGTPLIDLYAGPLYFVKYQLMASVAGQDNCAFLIRTDGVKLYGVNLLGCSDESLLSESGQYELTNLNLTGTTLEVNASCEILNCRVRNGRNVVRVYGGNREGNKYFIDSLSENTAGVDRERITVKLDGCIFSQGREFILKIGANRALRATARSGEPGPQLLDESGRPYAEQGTSNRYAGVSYETDSYFYKHYVMTDVTLKNSVVETSGLFTVGIESNFAGEYLYENANPDPSDHYYAATPEWRHSGGTSFASVLRLEGDVRLYDWKDLSLVNSSTLIESPVDSLNELLKLDIKAMLEFVCGEYPEKYGDVIENSDGKQFVHGGIALYGGGRNYSGVTLDGLEESLSDFLYLNVNIGVLKDGGGAMETQGSLLPKAAGRHDFNFYMYGKSSANNYVKQLSDAQKGLKYKSVLPVAIF